MSGTMLSSFRRIGLTLLLALTGAAAAVAGGFWLGVELPSSTDPQAKDAVLQVRPLGCHDPAAARLQGTAEGLVDGRRLSVPLQLKAPSKGVYTVERQWPAEGTWVLTLTGTYRGLTSSALVELSPEGTVRRIEDAKGRAGGDLAVHVVSGKLEAGTVERALQEAVRRAAQPGPAVRTAGS